MPMQYFRRAMWIHNCASLFSNKELDYTTRLQKVIPNTDASPCASQHIWWQTNLVVFQCFSNQLIHCVCFEHSRPLNHIHTQFTPGSVWTSGGCLSVPAGHAAHFISLSISVRRRWLLHCCLLPCLSICFVCLSDLNFVLHNVYFLSRCECICTAGGSWIHI